MAAGHVLRFRRSPQSKVVVRGSLLIRRLCLSTRSRGSSWSCAYGGAVGRRIRRSGSGRGCRRRLTGCVLACGVSCAGGMQGAARTHAVFYRCSARTLVQVRRGGPPSCERVPPRGCPHPEGGAGFGDAVDPEHLDETAEALVAVMITSRHQSRSGWRRGSRRRRRRWRGCGGRWRPAGIRPR